MEVGETSNDIDSTFESDKNVDIEEKVANNDIRPDGSIDILKQVQSLDVDISDLVDVKITHNIHDSKEDSEDNKIVISDMVDIKVVKLNNINKSKEKAEPTEPKSIKEVEQSQRY